MYKIFSTYVAWSEYNDIILMLVDLIWCVVRKLAWLSGAEYSKIVDCILDLISCRFSANRLTLIAPSLVLNFNYFIGSDLHQINVLRWCCSSLLVKHQKSLWCIIWRLFNFIIILAHVHGTFTGFLTSVCWCCKTNFVYIRWAYKTTAMAAIVKWHLTFIVVMRASSRWSKVKVLVMRFLKVS